MRALKRERNGSVSSRIRRDERKNARVPMKRFAREKNTTLSGRGTSHTKQVPLRTLMIKLNSWLISAWNANVSVSPLIVVVVVVLYCARRVTKCRWIDGDRRRRKLRQFSRVFRPSIFGQSDTTGCDFVRAFYTAQGRWCMHLGDLAGAW